MRRLTPLIAVALFLVVCPPGTCEIVYFDNSGLEFRWMPWVIGEEGPLAEGNPLDVFQDSSQTAPQFSAFWQLMIPPIEGAPIVAVFLWGSDDGSAFGFPAPFMGLFALQANGAIEVIPEGELIGMDRRFIPDDPNAFYSFGAIGELVMEPEPWINWFPLIGDGTPQYAGFLVASEQDLVAYFGWMRLLWNPESPDSPLDDRFDVLGWALEMSPFTPIRAGQEAGTIPEPGGWALFGAAVMALWARARKRRARRRP